MGKPLNFRSDLSVFARPTHQRRCVDGKCAKDVRCRETRQRSEASTTHAAGLEKRVYGTSTVRARAVRVSANFVVGALHSLGTARDLKGGGLNTVYRRVV